MTNENERDEEQARRENARDLRDSVSDSKSNGELYIELHQHQARMIAVRFKTLVEEGLSRAEALHVIAHRGLM